MNYAFMSQLAYALFRYHFMDVALKYAQTWNF